MRKLTVFNQVSLDGYFTDAHGDMSWAHRSDPEWDAFAQSNATGGGTLLFGRITYEQMASFWPTAQAKQMMPVVADAMNTLPKVVFSRTLNKATWANTALVRTDLVEAVRGLKQAAGSDLVILGSGTIVSQLAQAGLVDVFQVVLNPLVLGQGRTMFEGVDHRLPLKLTDTRRFTNGNVVLSYEPADS